MKRLLLLLLVPLISSLLVAGTTGGALLDWSDGSAVVTLQPLSQTVIDGYVVNAFYNGYLIRAVVKRVHDVTVYDGLR